jgi:protein XagA
MVRTRMDGVLLVAFLPIALFVFAGGVQASAWTMPKGRGQAITTVSFYSSRGGFDDQGQPVAGARFQRIEIATYAEYGVTNWLTVGLEPRYDQVASGTFSSEEKSRAPGDLDLFTRQHLFSYKSWVVSLQELVKLPLYSQTHMPSPGNGRREFEARLAIGKNAEVFKVAGFLDTELAYRHGTDGLADQIREDLVVGARPWRHVLLLLKGYRTQSLGFGDGRAGSSYNVTKVEGSVVVHLMRGTALELGGGRDLEGERVGLGTTVETAIWVQF